MNNKNHFITLVLIGLLLPISLTFGQNPQFKALIFSKTAGFRHQSIPEGVAALKKMGKDHLFEVYATEDARVFSDKGLESYDVIILMSTTGTIFNEEQKAAFQKFVRSGKGVVGIHSATDTEYEWPWYNQMIGAQFKNHPHSQTVRLQVLNKRHPATYHLPDNWLWTDELYAFKNFNDEVNVLITADETSYDPKEGMGEFHPMAWYHEFDGGRVFYTALGHVESAFQDHDFIKHLFGGIWYAAKGYPLE